MAAHGRAAPAVGEAGTGLPAQRHVAGHGAVRARQGVLRPGGVELVSVVAGTLAMLVIALAGLRGAAGHAPDGGVALAVDATGSAGAAQDGIIRVVVRNGSSQPYTGTVVATAGKTAARQPVTVQARAGSVVELRLPRACGEPALVTLDGAGSDGQAIATSVPCAEPGS